MPLRQSRLGPWRLGVYLLLSAWVGSASILPARADVTSAQVERAIRQGVVYLISRQQADGQWPGQSGMTPLATLALLTAGEAPDSPAVQAGLDAITHQRGITGPETYTISLRMMALAAADPVKYRPWIENYARRLQQTQIARFGRPGFATMGGGWGYGMGGGPDNSNTQYALLGLQAAAEAGVPIAPIVWSDARRYWLECQQRDGGWSYGQSGNSYGSMTTAGVASLVITGVKLVRSKEILEGESIRDCGVETVDLPLARGLNWLANNFSVSNNPGHNGQYKLYYLYGLERAGRLSGVRHFGRHDWYREGAEELLGTQDKIAGFWHGSNGDSDPILATSFALLFLAKGRAPVLINKLRHPPGRDWNNDPDDLANLVAVVSRDWKHLMTSQVVDPDQNTVEEMLVAPISYLSGHQNPSMSPQAKSAIREYVTQGGFLIADACCSRTEFDDGFRDLMKELFPDNPLNRLGPEHPVWRSRHDISPDSHPLWGIEQGCRTVVVYSPTDLSCYWNLADRKGNNPKVVDAIRLGQNIIDYATGRELPADKLAEHKLAKAEVDMPKRGALRIAKLKHAGVWNVAPMAVPNLTSALRDKLKFDVVINHRELAPSDPNLVHHPLVYLHGRAGFAMNETDRAAIRRHLTPGAGTLFADAACGSEAFDKDFRKLAASLFPLNKLEAIPADDEFYTKAIGFDLSDCQLTRAAGGKKGIPQLEGIKVDGRWALIYSKYDIGCALEKHQTLDCKGYTTESALKIATNIVIYATLP